MLCIADKELPWDHRGVKGMSRHRHSEPQPILSLGFSPAFCVAWPRRSGAQGSAYLEGALLKEAEKGVCPLAAMP